MKRLILASLLALSGCGFEPLYEHGPGGPTADLPEIYVNNIGGRYGQLLRERLQEDLGSPVSGADARYQLDVLPGLSGAGIGIQPDNSTTFTRVVGTATWSLRTTGIAPVVLASSSARSVDGYNNYNQQYFQGTISGDASQTRLTSNLADEITLQVASWFKRRDEAGQGARTPPG
jgi:LPS-assembly lipoprotein